MHRSTLTATIALVLLLSACGGGGEDEASAGPASSSSPSADASTDPAADPTTAPPGDAVASMTVDGTTWEMTEVLDCTIGSDGFPDDRSFSGRSADGAAVMDIAYFEDEAMAGLNGASLEIEQDDGTVATVTWASSYAGADARFDISLRDDGADGVAEVGVVGPDVPEGTFDAEWSFTC